MVATAAHEMHYDILKKKKKKKRVKTSRLLFQTTVSNMTLLSRVLNHNSEKTRPPLSPRTLASNIKSPRVKLSITLESPPVVLYGQPHESSGSIVSGVLRMEVLPCQRGTDSPKKTPDSLTPVSSVSSVGTESEVELTSVTLLLVQTMRYTKPFQIPSGSVASCKSCATKRNTLARWDVLIEPATFAVGIHAYPFSHLLPGLLAASTKLGTNQSHSYIKYDIIAVAVAGSKKITALLPLCVLRSILRGPDRNSLRVFPPTDVTASAVLPNVIYPKSTFPIELRLNNIVSSKQDRRWRMRKLTWKLEENTKVRASVCSKHENKLQLTKELQRQAQLSRLKSGTQENKTSGLHHLTVQTSMRLETPPSQMFRAADAAAAIEATESGNRDIDEQPEIDEGVPNRPIDEALNFDLDFSRLRATPTSPGTQSPSNANASGSVNTPSQADRIRPMPSHPFTNNHRTTVDDLRPLSTNRRLSDSGMPQEELYLDELRVVSHGEIKSGWKSDFLGKGRIELVAEISAMECSTGMQRHVTQASSTDPKQDETQEGLRNGANISCDIDDPALGVFVNHVLVVEVVVAEELIHVARQKAQGDSLTPIDSSTSINSTMNVRETQVGVPTGAARVLRMQFKMNVTERSGLGIAWDDEVPPMYEDVRALSPPTYLRLATDTPLLSYTATPVTSSRQTPAILYGEGETPGLADFNSNSLIMNSDLSDLDEQVQDFRL